MRHPFVPAALCVTVLSLAVPAGAQTQFPMGQQQQQPSRDFTGSVVGVTPQGLMVEKDGQPGPLPVARNTSVTVRATGEPDFITRVQVGHTVQLSGRMVPPSGLEEARISLHMNPQQTAKPQTRDVTVGSGNVTINGVVVSLEPFAVRSIDTIRLLAPQTPQQQQAQQQQQQQRVPRQARRFVQQPQQNVAGMVRAGQVWQANVTVGANVQLILGADISLARQGDRVSVRFGSGRQPTPTSISIERPGTIALADLQPPQPTAAGSPKAQAGKKQAEPDSPPDPN